MKKLFAIVALLATTMCNSLLAQNNLPGNLNAAKSRKGPVIGVKGGVNFPRLYYTNPHLSDLPHDFILGLSGSVFVEIPFNNRLAIAPEVNYQQRGGATSYVYETQYDVNYRLDAEYVSLRLPFIFYIPISQTFRPYLFAAPEAAYAIGGRIALTQPGLDIESSNINVSAANYNPIYLGALGGAGLRADLPLPNFTLVLKAEAAVNYGFLDTFSESEHQETATSTNIHAYNQQGTRHSAGLELQLGIGLIPGKKDDVCTHFNGYAPRHIRY